MPLVSAGSWADGKQPVPTDWKCSFQIFRLELELYFEKFYVHSTDHKNKLRNQLLWELPRGDITEAQSHHS